MSLQDRAAADPDDRPPLTNTMVGRVRLPTLIFIRWVAIVGQLAALLFVHAALGFGLELVAALGVVGALAVLNILTALRHRGTLWLSDRDAALYLGLDLLQLLALIALTGGIQNPFALLVMAPVVVSAAPLPRRSTLLLAVVAILGLSLAAVWHLPLPWYDSGLDLPSLYLTAVWVAMIFAVVFIAAYVSSLALESRRMADALAATQLALAREQRLSALGALAAAAAHELGSPLATIAVVAKELEHEVKDLVPPDSAVHDDIALLRGESDRCRAILAELATRPEEDDTPYHRLPASTLVEAAAEHHRHEGVDLRIAVTPPPGETAADQPVTVRRPEMLHGLGTLLQNALQFAASTVEVEVAWDTQRVRLSIRDDGPGFDADVLRELGDPYLSTGGRDARDTDEHMGLGIFIAKTLLTHGGATLSFGNRPEGGAEVVVRWPRAHFESVRSLS